MPDQLQKIAREYAKQYPRIADKNTRKVKGAKIAAILKDVLSGETPEFILDIGASGCIPLEQVSKLLAPKMAVGADLDIAILPRPTKFTSPILADALQLPFSDSSVDVVICNHVYEHVSDSARLFREIFRVLKVGGIVYFGAMNARWPIEPHYDIPFLHWLPKYFSNKLVKKRGFNHGYLERPLTTPKLIRLVNDFERVDYTVQVITDPERYNATDVVRAAWIPMTIRKILGKTLYCCLPSYIWILKKTFKTDCKQ